MSADEHLSPTQFSAGGRDYVIDKDPFQYRVVTATPVGNKKPVGRISWYSDKVDDNLSNKVAEVFVEPRHRRRGLASAMYEHAQKVNPNIQHSHARTPDGRAWTAALEKRER